MPAHLPTALASLTDLGFDVDPQRTVTTTLLDTFDGRLHRAGLRLRLRESDEAGPVLHLSGTDTAPAHLAVIAGTRIPSDLPPGPFRARLLALTDPRALAPQIRVVSQLTSGALRDEAGKVVATVDLHEGVQVVDRRDLAPVHAVVEVHEIPGYAQHARRTRRALRDLGAVELEGDTLTECASAAGIDLAGFVADAAVPLSPGLAAVDGFRLVLANLATAVAANWQGTVDQTDPEFLHDLRIAIRRTRTVLGAAKSVLPTDVLNDAREGFGRLSDLTGTPRDLDVYLLEWSRYTDPLGPRVADALQPVRNLIERRRVDRHLELETAMCSTRAHELLAGWQAWLAQPVEHSSTPPHAQRALGKLVARRIDRAHRTLLERGRAITPDTPAEKVHSLRKDAKRLRYLLECFGSLLPAKARKQFVQRLKALQDNLGEHQDAEVHVDMLRGVAHELHERGASPDTMVAIGQLPERLDQRRLAARAEFAERFAAYDTPATQRALDAVIQGITA